MKNWFCSNSQRTSVPYDGDPVFDYLVILVILSLIIFFLNYSQGFQTWFCDVWLTRRKCHVSARIVKCKTPNQHFIRILLRDMSVRVGSLYARWHPNTQRVTWSRVGWKANQKLDCTKESTALYSPPSSSPPPPLSLVCCHSPLPLSHTRVGQTCRSRAHTHEFYHQWRLPPRYDDWAGKTLASAPRFLRDHNDLQAKRTRSHCRHASTSWNCKVSPKVANVLHSSWVMGL